MSPGNTGGHHAADIKAAHTLWADEQPILTACAFCPWSYNGTVAQGRQEAAEHRADVHPDVRATRRRRGHLQRFSQGDDGYREEGIANAAKVAESLARLDGAA